MNILVLPSWYPTETEPLSGSFFREQAIALAKRGLRVTVLICRTGVTFSVRDYDDCKVRVIEIRYKPLRILNVLKTAWIYLCALKQYVAPQQMDLIHVHSYAVSIYARVIKFFLKIPYVITEHSSIFARTELSKKSRALIRFGYRGAAEVIAVSDGLAKRIQPFCKTAVKVIPNMVSDSFFEDDPSTPDAFSATGASSGVGRAFSFLSVAFLHRNKGLDILLAAFAELSASDYDIQLAIGGDGEEYESLLALSQSLGVAQCVHFYGALSREAVKQRLRECDCFVLPSRTESFGIVYVEALALGKPIIMAATDAAATIVNVENGLIVPVEDSHALCRAMEAMLLDYGRYDKEIIVTDCKDRFSEAAVCDQIIRLYQQVSA